MVQSISPRPQLNNFSRATVPLTDMYESVIKKYIPRRGEDYYSPYLVQYLSPYPYYRPDMVQYLSPYPY